MYRRIMVPLDGSELAECVLPHVEAFIDNFQVEILALVRVVEPLTIYTSGGPHVIDEKEWKRWESNHARIEADAQATAQAYLEKVAGALWDRKVQIRTDVIVGKVADSLVEYCERSGNDLIIIATHGRSGISRWVRGSIADRILRGSLVPVMMVRSPGNITIPK
jgi:nucleotide-binding universal stress UspA family protein